MALIILLALTGSAGSQTATNRVLEDVLWKAAVTKVMPSIPADASATRDAGICVAEVRIDKQGLVIDVTILEGPSVSVSRSVEMALRLWSFRPNSSRERIGKITLYFVAQSGRLIVKAPAEAGFLGLRGRGSDGVLGPALSAAHDKR